MSSVSFSVLSDVLIANKDLKVFFEFIKQKFDLSDASFEDHRKFINRFVRNHMWRWQKKCHCNKNIFRKKYGTWLNKSFNLPKVTKTDPVAKDSTAHSIRTVRRRAEELRQTKPREHIQLACVDNIRQDDPVSAQIVKKLLTTSTVTKDKILQLLRGDIQFEVPYTSNEALAFYVDLKCTRQKYELLHTQAKTRNSDLYPPYYKIAEAKNECYPKGIEISEVGVRIPLQSILNHTVKRLVETFDASMFENVGRKGLEMLTKWGMDGASGQSSYKQIFKDDDGNCSDQSVFMISMMPLQIQSADDKLWTNPNPSSTKLCRPICFEFMKESEENTGQHYKNIENQINKLKPTAIIVGEKRIRVYHKLNITMIDGKSTGYLTSTANCNCPICGAKPTEMSNIELVRSKNCNEENYRFGLSTLHCWIRFFECLLHIAFKMPIRRHRAMTAADKAVVKENKQRIQHVFKTEKGRIQFFNLPMSIKNFFS